MIKFTEYFLSYVSRHNYLSKSIRITYRKVILCLLSPLQWTSSFKHVSRVGQNPTSVTYYTQLIPISFSGILNFTGLCKTVHKKLCAWNVCPIGRPFPHMREVVHQMLRPTQLVFSLALRNMHNAYIALLLIYGVCNTQQQIFFGDIFMVSPESRLQLKLMSQLTILKQLPSTMAVL